MNKHFNTVILAWVLLVSCTNPLPHSDRPEDQPVPMKVEKKATIVRGKVVGISDGDTFTMLVEGNQTLRIRLYGVDAPEKAQDYGTQAKKKLSALIFSKRVEVEQRDVDRYGRLVGIVFVQKLNVNEELLKGGYVWHYSRYDDNTVWEELEQTARLRRLGLWSGPAPTAPWEWRREKREAQGVGN